MFAAFYHLSQVQVDILEILVYFFNLTKWLQIF